MADYTKYTWVDETGIGNGSIFTAARMQNIEDGIVDAAGHNKSGTFASRPAAAAGNKGWIYFCTDTLTAYLSTGAAWLSVAAPPPHDNWKPSGALLETFPRAQIASVTPQLLTGVIYLSVVQLPLKAGVTYTSITFFNENTLTLGTPTNQWFTLVDVPTMQTLRTTIDGTSGAWAAAAAKTLALSSAYTPSVDKNVYLGIMIKAASDLPKIASMAGPTSSLKAFSLTPQPAGKSSTGRSAPMGDGASLTSLTSANFVPPFYGYIS